MATKSAIRAEAKQIYQKIGSKTSTGYSPKPNAVGTPARFNREFNKIYKQVKSGRSK